MVVIAHVMEGLDSCSTTQRRLRALMALLVLNPSRGDRPPSDTDSSPPGWRQLARWDLSGTLAAADQIRLLPDELLFSATRPDELVDALIPTPHLIHPTGLPGLRLLTAAADGSWLQCRHVPTRALIRIEALGSATIDCGRRGRPWQAVDNGWALTSPEMRAMTAVPAVHPHARTLLSALLARLTTAGPERFREASAGFGWHRLWGRSRHWVFWCENRDVVMDLATALVDAGVGLPGASLLFSTGASATVGYGNAALRLSSHVRR
ncbi:hypothetical protein GCM10010174_59840 [Kutzneria viridogrisea]